LEENCAGDLNSMYQMYPPTSHYAFQMSGSKFFSGERLNLAYKQAMETPPISAHRYKFGIHFEQTEFVKTDPVNAECLIWEEPVAKAQYVIGADPAYGSSEWADKFCLQVWRCYADRIVMVAEVATADWTPAKFAWVLAHLGACYTPCMVNLELQGPGEVVYNELQNLRRYTGPTAGNLTSIYAVALKIRDFLWKKPDSFTGGFAPMSRTTMQGKIKLMETLRSYFERGMVDVRSTECIEEFRNISRDGDKISGEGRAKDDRAIAAGLAVVAWDDWIRQTMQAQNKTYALEMAPKGEPRVVQPIERNVMGFMKKIGVRSFGGPA